MVIGIGMDVISVARMKRELARPDGGFLDAVFTEAEITQCAGSAKELALRFAGKEAAAKALGTGISEGVSWDGIEVLQEASGSRRIVWHGGARLRAETIGARAAWLSCAADSELGVAYVVLEGWHDQDERGDNLFYDEHREIRRRTQAF